MAAIQMVYRCVEGDLCSYLGMKLVRDRVRRTITISQPGYIEDLREDYGITSTHGPLTPMVDKPREPESDSNPLMDAALCYDRLKVRGLKYNLLSTYTPDKLSHP